MKINIYKILTLVSFLVFFTSCEDQGDTIFTLDSGSGELAANLIVPSSGVYLRGETETIDMSLELATNPSATVSGITVYGQLSLLEGDASEVVTLATDVSEGTVSFTTSELFNALPVNGQTLDESSLLPGDQFIFTYEISMQDGRIFDIASKYNVTFSCPSDLAGNYSFESSGGVGDGSGGQAGSYSGLTGEVTLTDEGSGIYTVDDMSFGLYDQGYGDTSPPGRIEDVCGSISDLGDVDQYSDPFTISGTVNEDGTIELTWGNTWGDTGNVVLTPVE